MPRQQAFRLSVGGVQWVGLAYLLTLVASLTAVGRYADMAGRKLLYTYGFIVFIAGSALCGISPDLVSLLAFRVMQAVGAAMVQANSVAIITAAAPRDKLGRAIGVQGAAQALGLALGPAVAFAVAFVRHEGRALSPMVDLALMKVREFWLGLVSRRLIYLSSSGNCSSSPTLSSMAFTGRWLRQGTFCWRCPCPSEWQPRSPAGPPTAPVLNR